MITGLNPAVSSSKLANSASQVKQQEKRPRKQNCTYKRLSSKKLGCDDGQNKTTLWFDINTHRRVNLVIGYSSQDDF